MLRTRDLYQDGQVVEGVRALHGAGVPGPASIRFEEHVTERLSSYVARHPGLTRSAVAARFVDEGLRMDEHPGILFRDGPAGRRAVIVAGPDVWEVIRDVKAGRAGEPSLSESDLISMIVENAGVATWMIRAALTYWAAYPADVEAMIAYADEAAAKGAVAAARAESLLEP